MDALTESLSPDKQVWVPVYNRIYDYSMMQLMKALSVCLRVASGDDPDKANAILDVLENT